MPKRRTGLSQRIDRYFPWVNRFLTVALIITIVGTGALWIYQRVNHTPQLTPTFIRSEKPSSRAEDTEARQLPQGQRIAEIFKTVLTPEELAAPETQKLIEVIESPAYAAFLETNPHSLGDFFDFLYQNFGTEA